MALEVLSRFQCGSSKSNEAPKYPASNPISHQKVSQYWTGPKKQNTKRKYQDYLLETFEPSVPKMNCDELFLGILPELLTDQDIAILVQT